MAESRKDIILAMLERRYNVVVSESTEHTQDNVMKSIHNLCPELTAFREELKAERAWTTIIFHAEEPLKGKPLKFQEKSVFKWDKPTTVILVHNRFLANYSLTFKAERYEDVRAAELFIRNNSDLINHVLVLDTHPYRNKVMLDTFLPSLKVLPQSLSICVLVGTKRFGATDEVPLISEIKKVEEDYKNEFGEGSVFRVDRAFSISSFTQILHPSVGYHSYMYSTYHKALDNALDAMRSWDAIWKEVFRDGAETPIERLKEDVSCVLSVFDYKYKLLSICPGWKDVVDHSIKSGDTKGLSRALIQYFKNEIAFKKGYIK